MGFLSDINARREAAAAQRREEQQAAAAAAREERAAGERESTLCRKATYGDAAPATVQVLVRRFDEIREPRKKEDRSFFIVFERDRLFTPHQNPMQGDAWELRTSNPDELLRRFSSAGLPW